MKKHLTTKMYVMRRCAAPLIAYGGGYRNPVSGRCLDDPGLSAANGTQPELWDCNGGANQQWTTLPVS